MQRQLGRGSGIITPVLQTLQVPSREVVQRVFDANGFHFLSQILRDVLEPIGFEGIQLESEKDQNRPLAVIEPMRVDSSGRLRFLWSVEEIGCPTWEIRLEITSNAKEWLGRLSLIRSCRDVPVSIGVNVLTNGFQTSPAGAIERAYRRRESVAAPGKNGAATKTLAVVAGSRGD